MLHLYAISTCMIYASVSQTFIEIYPLNNYLWGRSKCRNEIQKIGMKEIYKMQKGDKGVVRLVSENCPLFLAMGALPVTCRAPQGFPNPPDPGTTWQDSMEGKIAPHSLVRV